MRLNKKDEEIRNKIKSVIELAATGKPVADAAPEVGLSKGMYYMHRARLAKLGVRFAKPARGIHAQQATKPRAAAATPVRRSQPPRAPKLNATNVAAEFGGLIANLYAENCALKKMVAELMLERRDYVATDAHPNQAGANGAALHN